MTATIRAMKKADLGPVSQLAAQLVRLHHDWDERRFLLVEPIEDGYAWFFGTQLRKKNVVLLVAELDGELAGYFYGTLEGRDWNALLDDHGAVHDIFVAAEHRRHGLAKQLMEAGLERLTELGAPRVVLLTTVQNTAGQALFESLGFRKTMIEMTRG